LEDIRHKTILLISPEAWGVNHVSKHHYAELLSGKGNKVFFLNPPSSVNKVQQVAPGLFSVDYQSKVRGINRLPRRLRDFFAKKECKRINTITGIKSWDIVWSFDPYRFQNLDLFPSEFNIFHPVDIHHTRLDLEAASSADIVLCVSKLIAQKYESVNTNIFLVNHGLADQFITSTASNSLSVDPMKTHVGYVGNLLYPYIDIQNTIDLVKENKEVIFHFFGPYGKSNLGNAVTSSELVEYLIQAPNCILYGSVPSAVLPGYIKQMDAFFISYKSDSYKAELSNSHKVLEYLSTGKILISHYIDEYQDKTDLIEMVDRNVDLPGKFKGIINNLDYYNRSELRKKRIDWARNNTYAKQLHKIEQLISKNVNS
jgi:hypothetical protein